MPVVSVSMPTTLIERIDSLADEHDYSGRSDVVREATRTLLSEFDDERLEERPLAGYVWVRYAFGTQSIERRVAELRHEFEDAVTTDDHSHVGESDSRSLADGSAEPGSTDRTAYCLDLFVLEGDLETVSAFVGRLRSIDGVETVDYSLFPLDTIDATGG
ncbi:CopG family ribbon-helix-helix protein [Natrarchaeobius oligotrophus]|uniref:Nickel-responsive transcriptional regulator NikR n=1 Tax=Natrarchaeobius chitinivorans TaxID=1679083 RepID=A0A3N6MEF5_NATCH|nr:CopG family ribbon-helix-helix protein [Natrarchaeobius chitinivorans]RQH01198.1 nickel-responsive transcriptional regulator NikR [Natrarchaeobius chitinivorans]